MSGRLILPIAEPVLDADGRPDSGAELYLYEAGTTTLANWYADEGLSAPILNPQEANVAGRFFDQSTIIWLGTGLFDLKLQRTDGSFNVFENIAGIIDSQAIQDEIDNALIGGIRTLTSYGDVDGSAAENFVVVSDALMESGYGSTIEVNEDVDIGVTTPDEPGVQLRGGSAIHYSPTDLGTAGNEAGRRVLNRVGRDPSQLEFGHEYLTSHFLYGLQTGGALKIILVGDSNVESHWGAILASLLGHLPVSTVVNAAVGGTTAGQWLAGSGAYAEPANAGKDAAGVMAQDPDLIIMSFGTNVAYYGGTSLPDGGTAVAELKAALDYIRAHADGSAQLCSVLVTTPTPMNDGGPMGVEGGEKRDERFNFNIRRGYMLEADLHDAAFFDINGRYPDTWVDFLNEGAPNLNLDSARVHAQHAMSFCIAWGIYDFLVPVGYQTEAMVKDKAVADLPSTYPRGFSMARTTDAPANGFLATFVPKSSAGNFALQFNWAFAGAGAISVRHGITGNAWAPWGSIGRVGTITLTPGTGFTLPDAEDASATLADGFVVSDGYVAQTVAATITAGQTIATIGAAAYRPATTVHCVDLMVFDGSGREYLKGSISPAGVVQCEVAGSLLATRVYIEGAWRTP